jgi:7SK snRNA methylphosphate capping enzyme
MTSSAAPVGNYHGYYSMRSLPPEERLRGLQREWIYNRRCLDVGCNSGHITFYLAQHYLPKSMLGIDVDSALIHRARERLVHAASTAGQNAASDASSLKLRNPTFMPRSVRLAAEAKPLFPQNLSFMVQDVLEMGQSPGKGDDAASGTTLTYGTIFCLSLTKWIHLNHGDEGLLRFFRILHGLLDPDGYLILEFQAWQSYINNKNTSSVTKKIFKSIQIKPEQFESELVSLGFEVVQRLGAPVETARGFNRPMLVLRRRGSGGCEVHDSGFTDSKSNKESDASAAAGGNDTEDRACNEERMAEEEVNVGGSISISEEEAEAPRKRKRKSKKMKKHKKNRQEIENHE